MSYVPFSARLKGASPVLLHNIRLSDPLNEWTRMLANVTSKRKKTDADIAEIARIEWLGSIYAMGDKLVIPGENVCACIREAGKTKKLGTAVKRGLLITDDFVIDHPGKRKSLDVMSTDPNYRERKSMKVGTARVMRTFPKISNWTIDVAGLFHEEILDASEVEGLLELAGQIAGIGDLRPRFGRFTVEDFSTG